MLNARIGFAAALSAATLTSLAGSAWGQCEPHLSVPDASALPSGVAVASTMWDPDGTGPLPPVLVIGGSMNFGDYPTWVPAQVIAWDGTTTTNMSQGFDIHDDHVNAVTSWNG